MNISLDKHFENFVASALESGRCDSTNELVSAALRLIEGDITQEDCVDLQKILMMKY